MPFLALLIVTAASLLTAQTHVLTGVVTDAESRQVLPGATIRILGGTLGTVANVKGEYRFSLPTGRYRAAASFLGYQSDTAEIDLSTDRSAAFRLFPNPVQMAAVTVTDEDPAVEIVRRAIAEKKKWMERLRTFEGKAFHRMTIRNDTSIAAITESYSTIYWTRGDSLREVITQQKQTGNLPKTFGASRVGEVMNFNDDRIALGGFVFTGPTAPDALDLYDFHLLSTRSTDGFDVYTIRITPRSVLRPLFTGTISIAERSYAVMEVDVKPNEAFVQPFIDLRSSRYRESFRLYGNGVWLPSHYRFDATFIISLAGLRLPAFGMERDLVIYDYTVNPVFADTIARMNKVTVDSSAVTVDTTFWAEHDVLPLTGEQQTAYRTLDSTQSLDKKFAPSGNTAWVLSVFGDAAGEIDVWFNRVEGFHLGLNHAIRDVVKDVDLRGRAGYGFSDHRWKWGVGASYSFGDALGSSGGFSIASLRFSRKQYMFSADVYDKYEFIPKPLVPGRLLNSISALLEKEDVHDYYRVRGGTAILNAVLGQASGITVTMLREEQTSLPQTTSFALINTKKTYAPQPGIADGRMTSLSVSYSAASNAFFALAKNGWQLSAAAENSGRSMKSDFDFTTVKGKVRWKRATWLEEESPTPPTLDVQLSGGFGFGHLPPQRYMELYSRFETFAGFGSLKGMHRREFYGDRFAAFTVSHNFRRTLFAPLGIRALIESPIDLIAEVNIARSWFSGNEVRTPLFPAKETGKNYYEASIGLSNLLDVFRVDVTRRFTAPADWKFSLTVSDLLTSLISP